jgi:hypothetical protein
MGRGFVNENEGYKLIAFGRMNHPITIVKRTKAMGVEFPLSVS